MIFDDDLVFRFSSKNYLPVFWCDLFNRAGSVVSKNNKPVSLVNANGYLMATTDSICSDKCHLIFEKQPQCVYENGLDIINNSILNAEKIYIFKVKMNFDQSKSFSLDYLCFLKTLIQFCYEATITIYLYTKEHLKYRFFDNVSFLNLDTIRDHLSEIIIYSESYKTLLFADIVELNVGIHLLLKMLNLLIKVSGARAILKNNALSLIYHLKILQKFAITL